MARLILVIKHFYFLYINKLFTSKCRRNFTPKRYILYRRKYEYYGNTFRMQDDRCIFFYVKLWGFHYYFYVARRRFYFTPKQSTVCIVTEIVFFRKRFDCNVEPAPNETSSAFYRYSRKTFRPHLIVFFFFYCKQWLSLCGIYIYIYSRIFF